MSWSKLAALAGLALLAAVPAGAGVRVQTRTVPGGVEIENRKLVVTLKAGAAGALVRSKAKGVEAAEFELAVLDVGGKGGKVGEIRIARQSGGEAAVRFACGAARAEIVLKGAELFVEVRPLEGAFALETRALTRYAILPDFFADDILYDPVKYKSPVTAVPAENFLLQLLEGKRAILMLVWEGTLESRMQEAEKKAAAAGAEPKEPKVELLAAGEGAARRFTAGRVEFLGKPVYAAVMAGAGIWHEEKGSWTAGAKIATAWKRPFEAKWRADYVAKDQGGADFWGATIKSRSFKIFDAKKRPGKRNPAGECYFDGERTCLATPGTPKYKAVVRDMPTAYTGVIIYPVDRTDKTPPSVIATVVDVMRNTLGEGPCEYIADLDGQKLRKWLVSGKDGVMTEGGRSGKKIGICPLHNFIRRQVGPAIKKNEKLDEKKLVVVLEMAEDLRLFANTIWERNKEYRQWGRDFVKFCGEQGAKSAKVKPVADGLAVIAGRIEAEMEKGKMRFNIPKKKRATGDEVLAYWNEAIPRATRHFGSGDVARYQQGLDILRGRETAYPASGGVNSCGDEIDWMVARLRRMVREIRHKAGTVDTNDPEVAAFCAKVRRQCHAVLRNKHARETWGGDS